MKINYRRTDGTRSTITLDDKLFKVWGLTLFQPVSAEQMVASVQQDLIPKALKLHQKNGNTLTKQVEHLMLESIEKELHEASRAAFKLAQTD